MAIAVANKRVKNMRKRGRISSKAVSKYGMDGDRDVDAATR